MNKITFIGAGNMAEALLKGLITRGLDKTYSICMCDKQEERLNQLKEKYLQITSSFSNVEGIEAADMIFLCVKPQQVDEVLNEIKNFYKQQLIVSIAAGISMQYIRQYLGDSAPIIRAMPNMPALIQKGITVVSKGDKVPEYFVKRTCELLLSVGKVILLEEEKMDAVTALSGSGPAYFYNFLNSLIIAGEKIGLTKEVATELVFYTGSGAIEFAIESQETLKSLIEKVTSKGGTTEAALKSFSKDNFAQNVFDAVQAAFDRSKELERDK